MNTIEPVLLKELNETDYESLISYRIRKILMICSNYDAFILEEDGQIEAQEEEIAAQEELLQQLEVSNKSKGNHKQWENSFHLPKGR